MDAGEEKGDIEGRSERGRECEEEALRLMICREMRRMKKRVWES